MARTPARCGSDSPPKPRVSSPAVRNWQSFENEQIKANQVLQARDKMDMWERKQKYKHELDLLVRVKNQQQRITQSMVARELEEESMRVSQALAEERTDADARKTYEIKSFGVTMANQEAKMDRQMRSAQEEKQRDEERLMAAKASLEREREMREHQRIQEALTTQMVKENQNKLLAEREAQQKRENKHFAQTELDRLDTMLRKNKEFMDGIRHRLDKYDGCLRATEAVHNDFLEGRRRTDFFLAHKPYEDRLKAELEKERAQLQEMQQRRTDLSRTLLRQIEENNLEKNQRLYSELQEEHRLLTQELERYDVKERQRKTILCNQLRQMMDTLQVQIKWRRDALKEQDRMTNSEVCLNNPKDLADPKLFVPGRTVQFVPGFAPQHDKQLMQAYQDKVVEADSRQLELTIAANEAIKENIMTQQSCLTKTRRRTLDQVSGIQKAQMMTEYEFIRNRHKNGVFNIITNNRK